jgi:hypothetical protein
VKLILQDDESFLLGNLTGNVNTLTIRGTDAVKSDFRMTLNARVEMSPEALDEVVREEVESAAEALSVNPIAWRCLSPGRPTPTFRYDHLTTLRQEG